MERSPRTRFGASGALHAPCCSSRFARMRARRAEREAGAISYRLVVWSRRVHLNGGVVAGRRVGRTSAAAWPGLGGWAPDPIKAFPSRVPRREKLVGVAWGRCAAVRPVRGGDPGREGMEYPAAWILLCIRARTSSRPLDRAGCPAPGLCRAHDLTHHPRRYTRASRAEERPPPPAACWPAELT
ncbi:hypothetical protein SEVIR_5G251000v4 [Setaria viridis]|uniref:Uncharacterized protein n=2 Tax=Setaria TaxID=4554 RepID=A0A368R8F3_SETIT|nr:hypothetical protein SETIT_5G243000v2 [Setaria italica]TKW15646.1 hypothetical protein SEVIR_5G251000v2 [Setaria viridis]